MVGLSFFAVFTVLNCENTPKYVLRNTARRDFPLMDFPCALTFFISIVYIIGQITVLITLEKILTTRRHIVMPEK